MIGHYKGGRVLLRTCALALAIGVLPACATPVVRGTPVGDLDYVGSRSSGVGGLSGTGGYAGGFTVAWSITGPDSSGLWLYTYTLTAPDVHGGGISHAIFGLTPGICYPVDSLNPCVVNADGTQDNRGAINLYTAVSNGNSNPGLPNGIVGVKFDGSGESSVTVEFYSPNEPVWGDFYAKGGRGEGNAWNAVWNNGIDFSMAPDGGFTVGDFIARPDGSGERSEELGETPEPASLAMVGGGMLALAYGLRKLRK